MKLRLLVPLAAGLAAATVASSAGADVFVVVKAPSTRSATLPSAAFPNFPGSVVFPANLSTPPASPVTLDQARLQALWQNAGAAYGIPWQVLAAINEIESGFGRNMGPSSAGAIGWMQFMPSTWMEWGVDANGDGVADPWNPYDAVYAAARYLAACGGTTDIARAIFSYNHADWYVQEVLSLAQGFGQSQGVTLTVDTVLQSLDGPRHAAAVAGRRAATAKAAAHRLAARVSRLERRASKVTLLSTRLALQARAGRLRERLPAAYARSARARQALARARQKLRQAKAAATAASFSAGAQQLLGSATPTPAGGWGVFSTYTYAGTDQGVDFTGAGPIPALAAGRVTAVRSEQIIEGGSFPVVAYQLEEGPYKGSYVYVAESFTPTVRPGQQVSAGQTLGVATGRYPYIEIGFADGPDGSAAAPLYPDPHGAKPEGVAMWAYIRSLLGNAQPGPVRTLLSAPLSSAHSVYRVVPSAETPVVLFTRP